VSSPSDAPVRQRGTHARSGNAMSRTRTAILDAAERCVAADGLRRTTMGGVADTGRVAKATLYNHFRTKDDLFEALVLARIEDLRTTCAGTDLVKALTLAAEWIAGSAAIRQLAAQEPAVHARLAAVGTGRAWDAARAAVTHVLESGQCPAGDDARDLVLRWLTGHVMWPATGEELALGAEVLAAGLVPVPPAGP